MLIGKMLKYVWALRRGISADSESDTERKGYLSWRGEWHAAAWGFSVAFVAAVTGHAWILLVGVGWVFTRAKDEPGFLPFPGQFKKESLYLIAHAVPGYLLGLAAAAI
ncbi:hypothetical protein [Natronomonas sp.]|uniref:hypothetical protein n=1 Tax=Natronomonas sp. TaxID=2184060 RepID=UPI002FC2CA7A